MHLDDLYHVGPSERINAVSKFVVCTHLGTVVGGSGGGTHYFLLPNTCKNTACGVMLKLLVYHLGWHYIKEFSEAKAARSV